MMDMKHMEGMKDMQGMDHMEHMPGGHPAPQPAPCDPEGPDPTLGGHGQLIVGKEQVYLSHLPMFMFDPCEHPHNFQVILEVNFTDTPQPPPDLGREYRGLTGSDPAGLYRKDREQSDALLYTLVPQEFVMTDLVSPDREHPRIKSFAGVIVRQHFERPNQEHPQAPRHMGVAKATVNVSRVVYFQQFDRHAQQLPQLTYLLFGKGSERFLAHQITRPPDFDQVLAVQVTGHDFTDADLANAVRIRIPGRQNDAAHRLKSGEQVTGQTDDESSVQLQIGPEFYFEAGELSMAM